MKKYFFLFALTVVIIILSGCVQSNQPANNLSGQTNKTTPASTGNSNPSVQPANLNTSATTNVNAQLGVSKEDLDKLKADINNMQFDNPNGLSQ